MAKTAAFDMERFFQALGDNTRLRLLNLMGSQELCVCYFVEILGKLSPRSLGIWRICEVPESWPPVVTGPGCTTGLCLRPMRERPGFFGKRSIGSVRIEACSPIVRGSQKLAAPRKSSSAYKVLPNPLR